MIAPYLASAALMGLFVAVVLVALARGPAWYKYTPRAAGEGGGWPRAGPDVPGLLSRPVTWLVAFVVTALIAVLGVFAIVTNPGPLSLTDPPALALGGLAIVYLVLGSYLAARDRGNSHALALGVAGVVVGAVFLLGIVVQLVS